jgi:hypothetical protein
VRKKAQQWTEDRKTNVEEIGKTEKKNQIASQKLHGNNKQIQNKYRAKGTTRQKNYKKTKAKQGKVNTNKENNQRDAWA